VIIGKHLNQVTEVTTDRVC